MYYLNNFCLIISNSLKSTFEILKLKFISTTIIGLFLYFKCCFCHVKKCTFNLFPRQILETKEASLYPFIYSISSFMKNIHEGKKRLGSVDAVVSHIT